MGNLIKNLQVPENNKVEIRDKVFSLNLKLFCTACLNYFCILVYVLELELIKQLSKLYITLPEKLYMSIWRLLTIFSCSELLIFINNFQLYNLSITESPNLWFYERHGKEKATFSACKNEPRPTGVSGSSQEIVQRFF